ncbi:MAG: sigma-54 dependent transcriptional regulator [Proteobacteria bacterium]|nr:sigma-54 dependent transcriptional regulator [Pseudomonadota bacterium]MBU1715186.1 sigma-54 dependent transcriptional regulator [Pseudomonadota bacterium]
MPTILVVDDELSMREFLQILLEKEGFTVLTASDGVKALELAKKETINLLISDIKMPGLGGLALLEQIKEIDASIPVIMITAYASPEDAVLAMKNGAYDYITKPFKVDEIKNIISTSLAKTFTSQTQKTEESQKIEGIIGESLQMMKIFDMIKRIAPTHANVLITGESGTGKELVARAIHNHSTVADQPFVPITCSAIPENLIESELFGHVKGSFTGAITNKKGLFELADNGSVFLDEIGELTPLIQTKLLRVLQEREFKHVGGTETIKVNVRIISATNKDLEAEVMAGRFREDLYYRLAVVPIRVPPLRERKNDVALLVKYFLKKYSEIFNKDIKGLSSYGLKILLDYDFPGNVRELENIIERGVALENSNIILPDSLALAAHRRSENQQISLHGLGDEDAVYEQGLDEIIAQTEKRLIEKALAKADYSKMRAAELLKISFRSLRYKVQKYNIT